MMQEEMDFDPEPIEEEEDPNKYCNHCGTTLEIGINWNESDKKISIYRCNPCRYSLTQVPKIKYNDLKRSAIKRGYEWKLNPEETSGLLLDECYYCGKESIQEVKLHGLDRLDNNVGYQKDNVVTCCEQCNRAKLTDTKEDFIEMCKRVADRHYTYEKSNMESTKIYLENNDLGEFVKENFDYPVW